MIFLSGNPSLHEKIEKILENLLNYCRKNQWQGNDPYDGLSSNLFQLSSLRHVKFFRLTITHLCKRSPVNLRKYLKIEPDHNSKGLALFLSGCLHLYKSTKDERYKELSLFFIDLLEKSCLKGYSGCCWGYNWDWQSRVFLLPRFTPTVVVTAFVAVAFIEAFETLKNERYLEVARSSCDFILNDLSRNQDNDSVSFSYSPLDNSQIYNATMLGASLLGRVYCHTSESELKSVCNKAINYVVSSQNTDGSWYYGNAFIQRWVDSYHTGFILEALHDLQNYLEVFDYVECLNKGFEFYKNYMFLANGTPKYYKNSIYPIEPHCAAQAIIVFCKLSKLYGDEYLKFAKTIANWTIENMMAPEGYFYYQKNRFYLNKISYMRWSQAWMFKALSVLLINLWDDEQK